MDLDATVAGLAKAQQVFATLYTVVNLTGHLYPLPATVKNGDSFDYVVVGGGTAGLIMASRLSEDPEVSVLAIEAGNIPPIEANWPQFANFLQNTDKDWNLPAEMTNNQSGNKKTVKRSQGKMYGGCSSNNLMYYVRGHPHDYYRWADITKCPSWNYTNVIRYFKKSERVNDPIVLNSTYGYLYGTKGPMGVTTYYNDVSKKYLKVFEDAGFKTTKDPQGETLGFWQDMYTAADGLRQSTANTYLNIAKDRKNLHILRDSRVTKIVIDRKKVARGVKFVDKSNKTFTVKANKEVILSAGVFHSPQLLLLSGIGPKEQLRKFNIGLVANLPVGKNIRNHQELLMAYKTEKLDPTHKSRPADPGDVQSPSITGFAALNKSQTYPDYQVRTTVADAESVAVSLYLKYGFDKELIQAIYNDTVGREILTVTVSQITQKPRGVVSLASRNPFKPPRIQFTDYPDNEDFEAMVDYAVDFKRIEDTDYFKSVGGEILTLPQCKQYDKRSREYIRCFTKVMGNSPAHDVGTCAIGSVVDCRLRVYGVKNLRVVDSSVMPYLPSGNTVAPTVMIGEMGAEIVKQDNLIK